MFCAIDRVWDKYRVDGLIAGYEEVENAVLKKVTTQVKGLIRNPNRVLAVPREIAGMRKLRPPPVETMIREVEASVRQRAERDLGSRTGPSSRISDESAARIEQEIRLARNNAASLYRRALSEALSDALADSTGVKAQRTLNRIADRGLRTTRGNESLTSFTRRSIRSALSNTAVETYTSVMRDHGHDLVVVSDETAECPICRRFEGKVLSIDGLTQGYTTIGVARSAGLFHPHCRHSVTAYQAQARTEKPDEGTEGRKEGAAREARRQERLDRRVSVALTPEAKRSAERRKSE